MPPVPSNLVKVYPQRGPLRQYRFDTSTAFECFRCGAAKKSKLISTYQGDWGRRLCNGCYGQLLSLFQVKAGMQADDVKAEALADALIGLVDADDQRQAERRFQASEARAELLSPEARRFVATAEYVADQLSADPQLEWSPAVIGLCKAVEIEVVYRLLKPLALVSAMEDLSADKIDKDIGRVASFCSGASLKPPEMGTFAHFLQTAIHSRERRVRSNLLRSFYSLASGWTGADWLLRNDGLLNALNRLRNECRNPAAHTDELSREQYENCKFLVIGPDGILWKLMLATGEHSCPQ